MQTHTTHLRVRYDECDPMGLVHHSNYLRYFEIGRTEMLRAAGGRYRDMEDAGQLVVVAKIQCNYKSPARYDDVIEVQTTIAKVTAAKIIHHYTITRQDQTLVTAVVTLAVIDRDGKLQRVPESLIQQYESF